MAHLAVVVLIELIPHFVDHFSRVWLPGFQLCDRVHVRLQQLLNLGIIHVALLIAFLLAGNLRTHVFDLRLDLDMHQLLEKHIHLSLVQKARVICVCARPFVCQTY